MDLAASLVALFLFCPPEGQSTREGESSTASLTVLLYPRVTISEERFDVQPHYVELKLTMIVS